LPRTSRLAAAGIAAAAATTHKAQQQGTDLTTVTHRVDSEGHRRTVARVEIAAQELLPDDRKRCGSEGQGRLSDIPGGLQHVANPGAGENEQGANDGKREILNDDGAEIAWCFSRGLLGPDAHHRSDDQRQMDARNE
jgi:hypothetical protein